nr:uncharacterized protein LOC131794342 [Pocillopora verrucosa]
MNQQSALIVAICVFLELIPQVSCAKELSDVDIIAIAVSLGLTAFLVVFVGCFVWRARNNPPINKNNNIAGHNNPVAVTEDALGPGEVRVISMNSLQYISSS